MTEISTPTPRRKRKRLVALLAAGIVVVAAGGAYAYWTNGGSGSGTATTGVGTGTLDVVQTSSVSNLRPGGDPQALSGHFDNLGDATTHVGYVTASIASVTGGAGVCGTTDYVLAHAKTFIDLDVPVGTDQGDWGTTAPEIATIQFNNKPTTNQDGCKGATVALAYVVSES